MGADDPTTGSFEHVQIFGGDAPRTVGPPGVRPRPRASGRAVRRRSRRGPGGRPARRRRRWGNVTPQGPMASGSPPPSEPTSTQPHAMPSSATTPKGSASCEGTTMIAVFIEDAHERFAGLHAQRTSPARPRRDRWASASQVGASPARHRPRSAVASARRERIRARASRVMSPPLSETSRARNTRSPWNAPRRAAAGRVCPGTDCR